MAPRLKLDPANANAHSSDEVPWERLDDRRFHMKSDYLSTYVACHDALLPQSINHLAPELNLSTTQGLSQLPDETVLSDRQMVFLFVNTYVSEFHLITKKFIGGKFDNNFSKPGFPRVDKAPAGEGAFARYDGNVYAICLMGYRVCPGNLSEKLNLSIRIPWWNKDKAMKRNAPLLSLVGPITLPEGEEPRFMDNLPDWAFNKWMDIDRGHAGFPALGVRLNGADDVESQRATPPAAPRPQKHLQNKRNSNKKAMGFALQPIEDSSPRSIPAPSPNSAQEPGSRARRFTPANGPGFPMPADGRIPGRPLDDGDEMDLDDCEISINGSSARRTSSNNDAEATASGCKVGPRLSSHDAEVDLEKETLSPYDESCLEAVIAFLEPPIRDIIQQLPEQYHDRILERLDTVPYPSDDPVQQYRLIKTAEERAIECLNACIKNGSINYAGKLFIHENEANTNHPSVFELGLWFFGHRNGQNLFVPAHITRYLLNTSEWQLSVDGEFQPTDENRQVSVEQWESLSPADRRRLVYEGLARASLGLHNPITGKIEHHIQPHV